VSNHRLLSGTLLSCLLVFALPALSQGTGTFTNITAPAAGTASLQGTAVVGIDTAGDVAGSYIDTSGTSHGFLYSAAGVLTVIDIAGANTGKNMGTFVTAIDAGGDVAGYFTIAGTENNGFVRTANGTISTFTVSTGGWQGEGTDVIGINSAMAVTGEYQQTGTAFVRSANSTITTFQVPIPGTSRFYGTVGIAINTAGVIAGRYMDENCISHGFVRSANGTIGTFDPPNVATSHTCTSYGSFGTIPTGIDTAGDIVGTYTDTNGARHSFLLPASGTLVTFDPPGTDTSPCPATGLGAIACGSAAIGINDAGQIVGAYIDLDGVGHGYLRSANGDFTTFNDSSAGTAALTGTGAFSINATGTIAGTYVDTNSVLHGFVGTAPDEASKTVLTPVPTPNPSNYGSPVTLSAYVSSLGGTPDNGESVTFMSGSTSLGTGQLTSGVATLTTTALPAGTDSITVVYGGDSYFAGSTSAAVNQVVMDFTVAANPPLQTVTAGQNATPSITVTPQNSFASTVSFACSVQPVGPTCSLSPTSVTPSGSAISSTLTVYTTASSASHRQKSNLLFPGAALAVALCFFGFKKQRRLQLLLLLAASITGLSLLNGCSSSPSVSNIQSAIYTVTVSATSGADEHTTPFILTVTE
jgi:hypothetical protein